MSGVARSWISGEAFSDWENFRIKFSAIFIREIRVSDRWDTIKTSVQTKDEHILEFILDKVNYAKI